MLVAVRLLGLTEPVMVALVAVGALVMAGTEMPPLTVMASVDASTVAVNVSACEVVHPLNAPLMTGPMRIERTVTPKS